jgi:hypothetical protein
MIFTAWANPLMLLIVEKTGWQTAYLTSAGLMLLAMIITCFLKYEDPNKGLAERPKLEIKLVNIVGKGTLVPIPADAGHQGCCRLRLCPGLC